MLQFDAATTRILDIAYEGADISRRRRASFDAVDPAPGEAILDIGSGNGLLTAELARAVGPTGRIVGIDPSADMRASALERCTGMEQVTLLDGAVEALPFADASFDKAVAMQVFEYLPDLETSCAEAMRVLKPGGRLVIADLHFDLFTWHSDVPDRMRRMIASWAQHCEWQDVPARLRRILAARGHVIEDMRPVTLVDHLLRPDGIAVMLMHLMRAYATGQGHVSQTEADEWFAEQEALAAEGCFFFSITQIVLTARKV